MSAAIDCRACRGPLCDHDVILGRLLGCESAGLCLGCLAFAFDLPPDRLAEGAVAHLRKKPCLWLPFQRRPACGCRLGEAVVADGRCA